MDHFLTKKFIPMALSHPTTILVIAASTFVLAYAFTWAARWIAPHLGFVDRPDGNRKVHAGAMPLLGGAAVFLAFVFGVLAIFLGTNLWMRGPANFAFGLALLASGSLYCGLGLWDDWSPLRARYKFLLQIVATIPFVALGPSIESLQCLGIRLDLGPMAIPFTILWIVSCANILNLIDGMDGLASSVGLIAVATLATLALSHNHLGLAAIGFVFVACLSGFLLHNWPPAKIFLGDSGSLTIGFVVGALSTGGVLKTATGFVLIFPIVLLSIPILDTVLAILRRKLMGQSIGDADYGHIHHRLQQRGLSKLQALLVIIGFCMTMAVGVIVAGKMGSEWLALSFGSVVLFAMIVGRVFGLYELNLIIRSLQIVHQVMQSAVKGLRARMSFLRFEATNPSDSQPDSQALWSLVESSAEAVGGTRVELIVEDQSGQPATTVAQWQKQGTDSTQQADWDVRYSVPREDGMRVTFFARGSFPKGEHTQQLENLVPLSAQICQIWPVEQPSVLPMEKHFLATDVSQPDVEREWVTEQRAA